MEKVKEALKMSINAMKGLYGGWRCNSAIKACENALAELEQAQAVGKVVTVGGYPDDSQHTVEWLMVSMKIALKPLHAQSNGRMG